MARDALSLARISAGKEAVNPVDTAVPVHKIGDNRFPALRVKALHQATQPRLLREGAYKAQHLDAQRVIPFVAPLADSLRIPPVVQPISFSRVGF